MHNNRVRELRKKHGLTQKALARLASTSQQQIQRIEGGGQSVRFDLAVAICAALGATMKEVFPATELPLKRAHGRIRSAMDIYTDGGISSDLERSGIDTDPSQWILSFRLRGGAEGLLPLTGREKSRFWRLLQDDDTDGFHIFDSGPRRYALNTKHLLFCHFLFEPLGAETDDEDADETIQFYLYDSPEPMKFDVVPDTVSIDEDDPAEKGVQLQELFYYASMDASPRLMFSDIDTETVFFRAADVAMFSALLADVTPSMRDFEDFDEEDEEHG